MGARGKPDHRLTEHHHLGESWEVRNRRALASLRMRRACALADLLEIARAQPNPTPELRAAIRHALDLGQRVKHRERARRAVV